MGLAILTAAVSLGASYAMKYANPWTSWVATLAALLLIIAGFPWLTVPGIFVLFALAGPPKEQPQALKKSGGSVPWWTSLISGALLIFSWGLLMQQGENLGLQATTLRPWLWLIWFCGSLADITVHELGHTLAAWAVGFRIRSICIGPLLIWNHPEKGRRFEWQWKRLFVPSGYVGCIPSSEHGVRWNMVFIVVCGPLISIITGLGLFSMLLAAPGSAWKSYWEVLATLTVIFVVDSLANLIPAGELDGARLWHLILWSDQGKSYVAALRSGKFHGDATAKRNAGNLEGEVELLGRALQEAVDGGERRPERMAVHHTSLGFALLRVKRWPEAEIHLKKSLEYLGSGDFDPILEANARMGLQNLYHYMQRAGESERSYEASLAAFMRALNRPEHRKEAHSIRGAIGRMHVDHGRLEVALDGFDSALRDCPSDAAHDHDRAVLFRSRAECLFLMGLPERGLEDVARAAIIQRTALSRDPETARPLQELAAAGNTVWKSGQWQPAVDLLRESVAGVESRGLRSLAASHRLTLSMMLRKAGRLQEAESALPREEDVPMSKRESLFLARGEIALLDARPAEAIRHFEAALRVAKKTAYPRADHIAAIECALAEAYLDADRDYDAEALATTAGAVLCDLENPEQCRSLLVLACLYWKRGQDGGALWRQALEVMRTAPLIEPATRARWFQQTAAKLTQIGHPAEAGEARCAAARDWDRLGFTPERASADTVLAAR